MSEPPPRLEGRLGVLLDTAIETVPHAVGAGLVALDQTGQAGQADQAGKRGRVIGHRRAAAVLDELQLRLGIGVLLEAAERDTPAVSTDLAAEPRWPELRPFLEGFPSPLAAIAVPGVASLAGELLLTVYAHGLGREQVDTAVDDLVKLVQADARRLVRDVRGILAGRRYIEQAKGLVMARRHCGANEAFELLRQASQQHQIKVRDLAIALLEAAGSQPVEPLSPASERARGIAGDFARKYLQ